MLHRPRLRLARLLALVAVCAALAGCSEVAVIRSAPVAAAHFDSRFGNDPLAATDAASLENALRARNQVWGIRIVTQPAAAGNVTAGNLNQLVAARGKVTSFAMVLTATAPATLQGFSAQGPQGEQGYLENLVQAVAAAGYARVRSVEIDVWFQSSHHSVLTWNPSTGFVYKVLDGKP